VPAYPDPDELYPEIAAADGLAAALRVCAAEQGLSVATPVWEPGWLQGALVPTTVPHRNRLLVSVSRVERRWSIRGCESDQDLALVEGSTPDLVQVARAMQAWYDGTALAGIARFAPFVTLTGRFEVPDRDPVQLAESEWQHLRKEAAEVDWPEYHALIEAAYAEARLRALYPFTSHWSLRFSTRTRPCLSGDILVCIHPQRGKNYAVTMGYMGTIAGETATAKAAVSLALRHLPENLDSMTYGEAG
jgi:hypothetical protein